MMFVLLITSSICKCDFFLDKKAGNKKISGKNVFLFLAFLIFSVIMSIRAVDVGIDTAPYTRIYSKVCMQSSLKEALTNTTISAPIYILICRILSYISNNPYIMIAFSAIFVNFFLIMFIKRTSNDYFLSIFCWIGLSLFYFSMNGCRQTMAMTLSLYSTYLILNNDYKSVKGWIFFAIAVLMHYTALFLLIGIALSFFNSKNKNEWNIFLFTSIISIIAIACSGALQYIVKFVPKYAQYISGENGYSIFKENGVGRIVILYLFLLCIVFLGIWASKNKNQEANDIDKFHFRVLPAIIFGVLFGIANRKNELFNRLLLFYISFYISYIPYVVNKFKGKFKFVLKLGIIFVLCIYSILTLVENKNGVVPYTTIFHI